MTGRNGPRPFEAVAADYARASELNRRPFNPKLPRLAQTAECSECESKPATHMSNCGDESYDPRPYCDDCHNEDDDA